jgi:hypothetical protein
MRAPLSVFSNKSMESVDIILPVLEGSEKQIRWATSIRKEIGS